MSAPRQRPALPQLVAVLADQCGRREQPSADRSSTSSLRAAEILKALPAARRCALPATCSTSAATSAVGVQPHLRGLQAHRERWASTSRSSPATTTLKASRRQLGNAMQQLDLIEGVEVITKPTVCEDGTVMMPWIEGSTSFAQTAHRSPTRTRDLIIHAPLNGVIRGLPDHGLDPVDVSKWGFRRVFTGHYHNHTAPMDSVISIGATTHQTWSDPGTARASCSSTLTATSSSRRRRRASSTSTTPGSSTMDARATSCRLRARTSSKTSSTSSRPT
jgi:hypothetical protein